MEFRDVNDDEEPGILQKYRFAIGAVVGIALVAAVGLLFVKMMGHHEAPPKIEQVTMVKLLPLPPTPPPPTPPPQVQPQPTVEPMVEQKQMIEPETKPEKPEQKKEDTPKSHDKAPGPLGLNAKGEGAGDAFGLVGKPGGNGLFGDGGGGGGSRWGWYAGQVQARVEDALRNNPRTRAASLRVEVRIWPDNTGRVTRVQVSGTTGDPRIDAAIKDEVLAGLQLQEPPPAGMPLPIVMRLTARRPN
jgi:hypothetical protein